MKTTKDDKGVKVVIVLAIMVFVLLLGVATLSTVDFKKLFKNETINITKTEKEVTVTDEGIADAVSKLYDATVIVEVGSSKNDLSGWGSGVVYDTDDKYGYILTNHHVVEGANYILIVYTDETEVEGEVVGSDEIQDIAVIKVPVESIKAKAEIGSSNELELGDTVFTIGTPVSLSYKFTVTRGILSGKDRLCQMRSSGGYGYSNTQNTWYMSLLQIDATINSGNSGGPLANSNGQLVGINNSKLSSTYSSVSIENMGFAIPIEDALNVADQLRKNGKVTRPFLGVSVSDVSQASRYNINLDSSITSGALITSVENDSTADSSGLKVGDVITKIGDYEVKNYKYFRYYLYRYSVGDKVKITYLRDGKEKSTDITLKS
jgi:serine protease Do